MTSSDLQQQLEPHQQQQELEDQQLEQAQQHPSQQCAGEQSATDPPSNPAAPSTDLPTIDPELTAKIERFRALKQQGIHFNDNLIQSKSYRNPNIYTKLVEFLNINEHQTNFDLTYWAPLTFPEQSYSHSLREQQRLYSEEKPAQADGKRTIEFESSNDHRSHQRTQSMRRR